jgi:hypothetical protein
VLVAAFAIGAISVAAQPRTQTVAAGNLAEQLAGETGSESGI